MTTDQPTTADIATGIRTTLATIRRHWPGTFDPPHATGAGTSSVPASRLPGNDTAISLRAETTNDLAFWVHAFLDDANLIPTRTIRVPVPTLTVTTTWTELREPATLDTTDVVAMCLILEQHAAWLSGWEHGNRLWDELITLAREVRNLASPPRRETMPIGDCDCGTPVRAKAHDPGNIKCRGCGTTDTIDGWIIRIVGNEPLVTTSQLVPILHRRLGVVASRFTISRWIDRGIIHASGRDDHGRPLFDRKAVFAALTRWDARRAQQAEAAEAV